LSTEKCAFRAFLQELHTGIVRREGIVTDAQLFGKRLRAARKAAGVKQGVLAKALDVDPKHISRLERGKVKPSFDLICHAARFLNLPFLELETAEDNPSVLKKRIARDLDTAGVEELQRVHRVLKALIST
jgi:transcriptional regulator with XRE-family HTH domain